MLTGYLASQCIIGGPILHGFILTKNASQLTPIKRHLKWVFTVFSDSCPSNFIFLMKQLNIYLINEDDLGDNQRR